MRNRFQNIAVLMGGPSAEREVSLRSGTAVAAALRRRGYTVSVVDVTDDTLTLPEGVEAVFVALHGTYGEDGAAQAELARRGLPFTGAGVAASRVAFDKDLTKQVALRVGVPTPAYHLVTPGDACPLPLPLVVKPARQGSSIGVHRVLEDAEWTAAVADAARYDQKVLAERFVRGRELTVGLLDDAVLPVVEIVAPQGWYNYGAKYTRGACRYLVPAPVEDAIAERCCEHARRMWDALDCRGMARVDFRVTSAGEAFLLEVNTIPGFTETSLLPKAAQEAGIDFDTLCERILTGAALDPQTVGVTASEGAAP